MPCPYTILWKSIKVDLVGSAIGQGGDRLVRPLDKGFHAISVTEGTKPGKQTIRTRAFAVSLHNIMEVDKSRFSWWRDKDTALPCPYTILWKSIKVDLVGGAIGQGGEHLVRPLDKGFHAIRVKAFLSHESKVINMLTNHVGKFARGGSAFC